MSALTSYWGGRLISLDLHCVLAHRRQNCKYNPEKACVTSHSNHAIYPPIDGIPIFLSPCSNALGSGFSAESARLSDGVNHRLTVVQPSHWLHPPKLCRRNHGCGFVYKQVGVAIRQANHPNSQELSPNSIGCLNADRILLTGRAAALMIQTEIRRKGRQLRPVPRLSKAYTKLTLP